MNVNWNALSDEDDNPSDSNQSHSSSEKQIKQQKKSPIQQKLQTSEPTIRRGQQKEPTYKQKPKFLTQQEIIQQINEGKFQENCLKVRGCYDERLKQIISTPPLKSREINPGFFIVYFQNKDQLISFIQEKVRQKYKFYINPCQKRQNKNQQGRNYEGRKKPKYTEKSKKIVQETQQEKVEEQSQEKQSYNASQQQEKSRKQSLEVDQSVKLQYMTAPGKKKDKPFFWLQNDLHIKGDSIEIKKVIDSMKMYKISSKFSCLRIIAAQKLLNVVYNVSDAITQNYPNWGEVVDRINPNLSSQTVIQIQLKQGIKKKTKAIEQVKKEEPAPKQSAKIEQKKQPIQHIQKVKREVHQKLQSRKKQQFFTLSENYLTIKSAKTSADIVLKSIHHENIWNKFDKIHLICEKKISDTAFQIADRICDKYKLEKIMESGQDHHQPTIQIILQPIKIVQSKGKQFSVSQNIVRITGKIQANQIIKEVKQKNVFSKYNRLKVQYAAPMKEQVLEFCNYLEQQLNLQMQQPTKVQDNLYEISLKQYPGQKGQKKNKGRKKSTNVEPIKKVEQVSIYNPIQAKSELYFNKMQQTNKHQIIQRIDIDEYCQGFKKYKNQIFKKWDYWVIRTHGQVIQNLLKLSWELEKKCGLMSAIRVESNHNIEDPYTIVEFRINKEKQQRPKKVDTYAVNSYLANR